MRTEKTCCCPLIHTRTRRSVQFHFHLCHFSPSLHNFLLCICFQLTHRRFFFYFILYPSLVYNAVRARIYESHSNSCFPFACKIKVPFRKNDTRKKALLPFHKHCLSVELRSDWHVSRDVCTPIRPLHSVRVLLHFNDLCVHWRLPM